MGKKIYTGRYTTENDQDVVVFIIGMRINKRLAVHKWGPVFTAMPGMIRELHENQDELGFLSMESYFGLRTTMMVQYWRSTEDLLAYAKGEKHLKAWQHFNKRVRENDAVGIYHETYQIKAGSYETVYRKMPLFGMGNAKKHIPIAAQNNSARKRLQRVKTN
ncbi:DUF4188 domain-containing protein [Oceanobacillus sp. J11TS1]|uniref:DUF4188 domain-containing protein n=1 Tax=Oceanobacillus sp. J11TS1 TaxID=2807191 RepID=UPI001B027F2C|nr:DUF4188 domain-containing protein [Oceanobacillus sp. J11TS1]GIO24101.1 transcriptional regulator [Oceanobacillus sp. J11TS1]